MVYLETMKTLLDSMLSNSPITYDKNQTMIIEKITVDSNGLMITGKSDEYFTGSINHYVYDKEVLKSFSEVYKNIVPQLKTFVTNYLKVRVVTIENSKAIFFASVDGDGYSFTVSLIRLYDLDSDYFKSLLLKLKTTSEKNKLKLSDTTYYRLDYNSYIISTMLMKNIRYAEVLGNELLDKTTNTVHQIYPDPTNTVKELRNKQADTRDIITLNLASASGLPVDIIPLNAIGNHNRYIITNINKNPKPNNFTKNGIYLFLNANNGSAPLSYLYKNTKKTTNVLFKLSTVEIKNVVSNPHIVQTGIKIPDGMNSNADTINDFCNDYLLKNSQFYDATVIYHTSDKKINLDYLNTYANDTKVILCTTCSSFKSFYDLIDDNILSKIHNIFDLHTGFEYQIGSVGLTNPYEIDNLLKIETINPATIAKTLQSNGYSMLNGNSNLTFDYKSEPCVNNLNINYHHINKLMDIILSKEEFAKLNNNKFISKFVDSLHFKFYKTSENHYSIRVDNFTVQTLINNFNTNSYTYSPIIHKRYSCIRNLLDYYKYMGNKNVLLIDDYFNIREGGITSVNDINIDTNNFDVIISTKPISFKNSCTVHIISNVPYTDYLLSDLNNNYNTILNTVIYNVILDEVYSIDVPELSAMSNLRFDDGDLRTACAKSISSFVVRVVKDDNTIRLHSVY